MVTQLTPLWPTSARESSLSETASCSPELRRKETRQVFFQEILDTLSLLGGDFPKGKGTEGGLALVTLLSVALSNVKENLRNYLGFSVVSLVL